MASIPDSVKATIKMLEEHPAVKAELAISGKQSMGDLMLSVEHDYNGWFIVAFPQYDLWMLQYPTGGWRQCYIGQDERYNKEVLEQKYNHQRLMDVHIKSFDETLAVYI